MKKILTIIIAFILIYLVYIRQPYINNKIDPISEINPLILVNNENALPKQHKPKSSNLSKSESR